VVFSGRRYDTGDRQDYLRAVVRLACEHPELGRDFSQWLVEFAGDLPAGATGKSN
jgi:UTP--glucose-1-phosphate uridylyltransferase